MGHVTATRQKSSARESFSSSGPSTFTTVRAPSFSCVRRLGLLTPQKGLLHGLHLFSLLLSFTKCQLSPTTNQALLGTGDLKTNMTMLRSLQLLRPVRCECAVWTGRCGNTEVCVYLPSPHQVPRLRGWFSFTVWESVEKNGE